MNEKPFFRQLGRIWKKGRDAPWTSVSQPKSPEEPLEDSLKPPMQDSSVPAQLTNIPEKPIIKPAENP